MEKIFNRTRSVKDITICLTIIITGATLISLPTSDTVNMLGFFLILSGAILVIFLRTAYKDEDTGKKYNKTERYFPIHKREVLLEALNKKSSSFDLSEEDSGNGLRLDIYHSKKTGLAYVQLFEYVPYKYEACSKTFEIEYKSAKQLI